MRYGWSTARRREVSSPVYDEIRVVHGTAQGSQQVKDVGIVVQDRALLDERPETDTALLVDALVKVLLLFREFVLPDRDLQRRQTHIILLLLLRPAEHHLVQTVP